MISKQHLNMSALVTAVIPTYNRPDLLKKAVLSIERQTYDNLEIIIVDNGILPEEKYSEVLQLGNNIKYVKISEHGANYARNRGIIEANGEYVAFLDDDDEWMPTKVEESMKLFDEDKNIGLVFTDKEIIYEEEGISYYSHSHFGGNAAREILLTNFIGSTSCVMVKASLLKENMFDVSMPADQDYDLWIRLCKLCKIGRVNKPLLKYYCRSSIVQISADFTKYIQAYGIIDKKYAEDFMQLNSKEKLFIRKSRINNLLYKALCNKDKQGYKEILSHQPFVGKITGIVKWILGYKNLLRIKSMATKMR